MIRISCVFLLAFVGFIPQDTTKHELKVEQDKENVVASRIEGNWQTHESLSQRLTGKANPHRTKLTFTSDPSVASKVPEEYAKFFTENEMKIYMAGNVQIDENKCPFILTHMKGIPHVFFWLEKDGKEFGNGESFNVMLAVAKDNQNDLLFVGGDFNNQAFSAYARIKIESDK